MNQRTRRTRRALGRRTGLGLCAGVAATCLAASAWTTAQEDTVIEDTRAAISEWVDVRRLISKERRDWQLGKEMMIDRIDLVEREITSLRERVTDTQKSIGEADEKLSELVAENDRLKEGAASLQSVIAGLEGRVRALLTQLPEPLVERVKPLSQQIPEDPESTEATLGERYRNVIGILNEVDRFNGALTLASEVRTLANGSTAEVAVLYVGLGQAFYVTAKGDAAGIGRPAGEGVEGGEGWVWTPANDAAESISKAIAIQRGELAAEFVPLPIQVD